MCVHWSIIIHSYSKSNSEGCSMFIFHVFQHLYCVWSNLWATFSSECFSNDEIMARMYGTCCGGDAWNVNMQKQLCQIINSIWFSYKRNSHWKFLMLRTDKTQTENRMYTNTVSERIRDRNATCIDRTQRQYVTSNMHNMPAFVILDACAMRNTNQLFKHTSNNRSSNSNSSNQYIYIYIKFRQNEHVCGSGFDFCTPHTNCHVFLVASRLRERAVDDFVDGWLAASKSVFFRHRFKLCYPSSNVTLYTNRYFNLHDLIWWIRMHKHDHTHTNTHTNCFLFQSHLYIGCFYLRGSHSKQFEVQV